MPIKDDAIAFLKRKQRQLMDRYAVLEDIQGEPPELHPLCQSEMDRVDWLAEIIRRKIAELEEPE